MARTKKVKLKDVRYSWKYILASVIVEALLLAPKTTVNVRGKDVEIGGVIPMLHKEIASGLKAGMDTVFPKVASSVEAAVRKTGIKEKVMQKTIWFVYDYMEHYSLNGIISSIMERAHLHIDPKFRGAFRDYLEAVLESRDDREKFIAGITDFLMNSLALIFAGTSVEVFLNGGLRDNFRVTLSESVDRFLQTDKGLLLVERLLDAVEQFENLTLAAFLERNLGMPRPVFEQYLSDRYEEHFGTQMVARWSNMELSSRVYQALAEMDYDDVFEDIMKNHWKDLVRVTITAASVGLAFTNLSLKLDAKAEKKHKKKARKQDKKTRKQEKKATKKAKKRK